jgi:hypothetical protein
MYEDISLIRNLLFFPKYSSCDAFNMDTSPFFCPISGGAPLQYSVYDDRLMRVKTFTVLKAAPAFYKETDIVIVSSAYNGIIVSQHVLTVAVDETSAHQYCPCGRCCEGTVASP